METTDNRSKEGYGQQERREDRSKRRRGQEIRAGNPAWERGAAFRDARETKEPEEADNSH